MASLVTEVPAALKRLVGLVMRGFYTDEHVILMNMLIKNPCIKEEDLVDLLKFEGKQLGLLIAQLKTDRFVKVRLRMETGADGKAARHSYYYINYKSFANVLKYKLDQVRRKIETEERQSISRASFKCNACEKTFTDLEVDRLIDFASGELKCSFCESPVVDNAFPKMDSRLMLARFNEQMNPLYDLLREVDDIKLAPEILEPKPADISQVKKDVTGMSVPQNTAMEIHATWTGDATRNKDYDDCGHSQGITINFCSDDAASIKELQEKKEQPIWFVESTIEDELEYAWGKDRISDSDTVIDISSSANKKEDDIEVEEFVFLQ